MHIEMVRISKNTSTFNGLSSRFDDFTTNYKDVSGNIATRAPTIPKPLNKSSPNQPNGGLTAWLQCFGSFILFFNCWGIVNTFGSYQAIYEETILSSISSSTISWIGSIQAFLLLFVGVFSGPLFDRGYLHTLLNLGTICLVLGTMMTSLATTFWELVLAQGIVVGLGAGLLFIPSIAILPSYFSTKNALAQGIAATGSSVGGVIFPIMFKQLHIRIGLPWATRSIGFVMLATLVIPIVTLKMRNQPAAVRSLIDTSALREPPFVLFAIAQLFAFAGLYIPFFYSEVFGIVKIGLDTDLAFYLLPFLNVGSLFGRIFSSIIASKLGPLNTLILCMLATMLMAFVWLSISSTGGVILFCLLYGFFSGSFVSLPPVVAFTLSPSIHILGTRIGMVMAWMATGLLVGNPIAGALLHNGWISVQTFCGGIIAVATVLLFSARVKKAGWSPTVKA